MTQCSRQSVANMASQGGGSHCGKSGGGRYCVAGGPGEVICTNSQFSEGISIHKFPDSGLEEEMHKKWVKFVMTHCPDFKASKTSVLCSAHFEEECFNYHRDVADQLGIRRSLVEGAVPSKDAVGAEETADPEPLTARARRMIKYSHVYLGLGQGQPNGPNLFVHEKQSSQEYKT